MLSLLPPVTHKCESYEQLCVIDKFLEEPSESFKESSVINESLKETDMIDKSLDPKRLLMTKLLQNLRHYAGFHIPPVSIYQADGS